MKDSKIIQLALDKIRSTLINETVLRTAESTVQDFSLG